MPITDSWHRVLALAAIVASCGCAGSPKPEPVSGDNANQVEPEPTVGSVEDEEADNTLRYVFEREEYAPSESFGSTIAPPGLEVVTWVTRDPGGLLAVALEALQQSRVRPESGAGLDGWERSGFALGVIEAADLNTLLVRFPPTESVRRRAWGTVANWQPLTTGSRELPTRVSVLERAMEPPQSTVPRVLVRGWVEPTVIPDAANSAAELVSMIRLELVPQWHTPKRAAFDAAVALEPVTELTPPIERGEVLDGLLLSLVLTPGSALVLAPAPISAASAEGVGPTVPAVPGLGAVLLRSDQGRVPTEKDWAGSAALVRVTVVIAVGPATVLGER